MKSTSVVKAESITGDLANLSLGIYEGNIKGQSKQKCRSVGLPLHIHFAEISVSCRQDVQIILAKILQKFYRGGNVVIVRSYQDSHVHVSNRSRI